MKKDEDLKITTNSITFLQILGLILITLKLLDLIDFSWWLILLPVYFPIITGVILLLVIFIVTLIREARK